MKPYHGTLKRTIMATPVVILRGGDHLRIAVPMQIEGLAAPVETAQGSGCLELLPSCHTKHPWPYRLDWLHSAGEVPNSQKKQQSRCQRVAAKDLRPQLAQQLCLEATKSFPGQSATHDSTSRSPIPGNESLNLEEELNPRNSAPSSPEVFLAAHRDGRAKDLLPQSCSQCCRLQFTPVLRCEVWLDFWVALVVSMDGAASDMILRPTTIPFANGLGSHQTPCGASWSPVPVTMVPCRMSFC